MARDLKRERDSALNAAFDSGNGAVLHECYARRCDLKTAKALVVAFDARDRKTFMAIVRGEAAQ